MERRLVLRSLTLAGVAISVPGLFAEELVRTPPQTEGPFYPDKLPLDTDNDLLIINDGITPAVGEITHLTGRSSTPTAIRSATRSSRSGRSTTTAPTCTPAASNGRSETGNFQGFGRFLTGSSGEYYFRTIKPVPYPGRTPHIHFKVKLRGKDQFTTQCYVKGNPSTRGMASSAAFAIRKPGRRACTIRPHAGVTD